MIAAPYTRDLTRPLTAYWVGDFAMYAAESAAQALALAIAKAGPDEFTLDDVTKVDAETLDQRRDNGLSIRGLLARLDEPGYLAGYEL